MDTLTGEALRLANDARRELGLSLRTELTPGMLDILGHCSIARTVRTDAPGIASSVDGSEIAAWVGSPEMPGGPDHTFALTKNAALFCLRSDVGRYPELVTEPGR